MTDDASHESAGLLETIMGVRDTQENRARLVATIPLGRLCRPASLAAGALYLAPDESEFVTGNKLPVDAAEWSKLAERGR